MIKKILFLSSVLTITLATFLLVGEIYLRNFTNYNVDMIVDLGEDILVDDPEMLWEQPGMMNRLKPYLLHPSKRNDIFRILLIGDSVVLSGEYTEKGPIFPQMLEGLLNKGYQNYKIELLTYASGGYNTLQEVRFYETKGRMLNPDLLILCFCHNDTEEVFPRIKRKNGRYLIHYSRDHFIYLKKVPGNRYLAKNLILVRLINEMIVKFSKKINFPLDIGYQLLYPEGIYKCFARLQKAAEATQTPVAVVIFPLLKDYLSEDERLKHILLKKWCEEFHFFNIDLLETYRKYKSLKFRERPEDFIHPNEFGLRLSAEFIAEQLAGNGYLPKDRL